MIREMMFDSKSGKPWRAPLWTRLSSVTEGMLSTSKALFSIVRNAPNGFGISLPPHDAILGHSDSVPLPILLLLLSSTNHAGKMVAHRPESSRLLTSVCLSRVVLHHDRINILPSVLLISNPQHTMRKTSEATMTICERRAPISVNLVSALSHRSVMRYSNREVNIRSIIQYYW